VSEALLAAARALAPRITAAGPEMDAAGRLPPGLVSEMTAAGLFRMALPRSVGGAEADLASFLDVTETLGAADGSVGWCFVQACFSAAQVVVFLRPEVAKEIFGDPQTILANGTGGEGDAVVVPGGYRLSGRWRFASGCTHATWLKALARVVGPDGGRVPGPDGHPATRTLLFPAAPEHLELAWDVSGLRGTGSHTVVVRDLFVPQEHTADLVHDPRREDGPLYRLPSSSLAAAGFGTVAMGIARGTLDAFRELAGRKTARGATRPLREDPLIQDRVARAEGQLRSVRALLRETSNEVWQTVAGGDALADDQRARFRLAATYGSNQAAGVVEVIYHAAGATAIFEHEGFARRFRDVHAVTQQIQSHDLHYQAVGRVLLGLPAEGGYM